MVTSAEPHSTGKIEPLDVVNSWWKDYHHEGNISDDPADLLYWLAERHLKAPAGKGRKKKPPQTLFAKFIDIYDKFMQSRGMAGKYNKAEGKAAMELINYIKKMIEIRGEVEPTDQVILDSWQVILNKYHSWDAFCQKNLKLSQINSNIITIIQNIKGHGKFAGSTIQTLGSSLTGTDQKG